MYCEWLGCMRPRSHSSVPSMSQHPLFHRGSLATNSSGSFLRSSIVVELVQWGGRNVDSYGPSTVRKVWDGRNTFTSVSITSSFEMIQSPMGVSVVTRICQQALGSSISTNHGGLTGKSRVPWMAAFMKRVCSPKLMGFSSPAQWLVGRHLA
jgi:hypothetical protein